MSVLRHSSSLLLYVLAVIVIVAAIALSLVRLAIPYVDDFRHQIQSTINNNVGREILIGKIDASWHHFKPQIELANVVITLSDEQVLEFGRVSLGVDIISSVRQWRLVTSEIRLAGFELNVVQTLDGRFAVAGLPASAELANIEQQRTLMQWLSEQQQVIVENGTVYFTSEQRPELLHIFSRMGIYFVASDTGHQLAAQVDVPAALGKGIELVANFDGLPLLAEDWLVDSYIKLKHLSAAGFAKEFIGVEPGAQQVKGGDVDLELWASIGANQLVVAQGRIAAENLRFAKKLPKDTATNVSNELIISSLSADFSLEKNNDEWAVGFAPLRIARAGASEQVLDIQVRYNHDAQARSLLLQVGAYRVSEMLDLIKTSSFIPGKLLGKQLSQLDHHQLGGDIRHTTLFWQPSEQPGSKTPFSAYIEFDDAFIDESSIFPGADSLSGFVRYQSGTGGSAGQLVLTGSDSRLDAPQWFRDSLQFDELAVDIAWAKSNSELLIEANDIAINNADLAIKGDLAVRLPSDKNVSPTIDLALVLERADISKRSLYMPAKLMHPKAVSWYDRALQQGMVSVGSVELKGPIKQFPFKGGEGLFALNMHISNGKLEYVSAWPAIENIHADLHIHNASIELLLNDGTVIDSKINAAKMLVPDFTVKPVAMTIAGTMQGVSSDALLFLEQSPLQKRFADSLKVLAVEGNSELSLELDIAIPGPVNVYGELALVDNRLSVANDAFVAENIDGTLSFDNQGLHGKAIAADILGMRTLVDLEPAVKGDKRGTKFSAQGEGDVAKYAQLSGLPWLAQFAQGESTWKAEVLVLGGSSELYIESDLVGIASQFPHPFAKEATTVEHFSLATALPFGSTSVALSLGDNVYADLDLKKTAKGNKLALLNIGLGRAPEKLAATAKGIVIHGELDRLILADWITAATALVDNEQSDNALSIEAMLDLDRLDVFGYYWNNVKVDAQQQQGDSRVLLNGEGINGTVVTEGVGTGAHITLDMESLALNANRENSLAKTPAENNLDPREVPTVNVKIKQFNYGSLDLGELAFKTSKIKQGQHIEGIAIRLPTLLLAGAGNWTQVANTQRSSFNVVAETTDLGDMLNHFGYAADNVNGGVSTINANVFWRGIPFDYSHEKLNGQISLSVKDINFSDIDPGAGRVFGLLSIQALPQRLSLDFSDLFKKGLQINTIEGSFSVKHGDAVTDDLSLQGPAARIDIAGRIGLAKQDYDQIMAVTPEVSSSLPLVGAVVAGPAGAGIGTAILFLHKLFNPKILHYKYHVSGPWADPEVVLLKNAAAQSTDSGSDESDKTN